jgi:hypothetical protein
MISTSVDDTKCLMKSTGVKFLEACLTGCLRSWTEFAARHELRAGVKPGSLLGLHQQSKNRGKITMEAASKCCAEQSARPGKEKSIQVPARLSHARPGSVNWWQQRNRNEGQQDREAGTRRVI